MSESLTDNFSVFPLSGTSTAGNICQLGNVEHTPQSAAGWIPLFWLPMQKSCTRVFATHNALVRHKVHKAQKRTPCADMEKAVKVYAVDDNRASSLQPSRIVEFPLSGTMITHDTHNTHDTTPNP
jgi:hypothetical protein